MCPAAHSELYIFKISSSFLLYLFDYFLSQPVYVTLLKQSWNVAQVKKKQRQKKKNRISANICIQTICSNTVVLEGSFLISTLSDRIGILKEFCLLWNLISDIKHIQKEFHVNSNLNIENLLLNLKVPSIVIILSKICVTWFIKMWDSRLDFFFTEKEQVTDKGTLQPELKGLTSLILIGASVQNVKKSGPIGANQWLFLF